MAESRLQRWARIKSEAGRQGEQPPPPATEAEPTPEEQELAINQGLPEHELLEKYGLPDPETIELGTDITGFMRKEIPELLRRKALRGLWKSNPVLAVLDGLNDYDEDFTDAGTTIKGAKTLYKVGQGLIDKTRHIDEQPENRIEPQAETPGPVELQAETPELVETQETAEKSEPEIAAGHLPDSRHAARPVVAEAGAEPEPEPEPEPRYRPRMRFE